MPRSLSGSPARKRQRLSSPTYDDQVGDLTQEDLAAFDAIEAQLSQDVPRPTFKKPKEAGEQASDVISRDSNKRGIDWEHSQSQEPSSSYPGFAFVSTKASNLRDDPDNPFSNGFASAATLPTSAIPPAPIAFASASKVLLAQNHERSPSPEVPPQEADFENWFKPATHATPVFQVAKFSTGSALAGFTKASNKGVIMPSKEALAKAKAKLDAWQKEEDAKLRGTEHENHENFPAPAPDISSGFKLASSSLLAQSPMRVAFQPVSNIVDTPATPSPAGFSRPSLPVSAEAHPSPNNNAYRPKQFKPPMLKQLNASNNGSMAGSPLNSNRPTASLGFTSAASQHPHPLAAPPISAVSIAPQHESSGSSAFTTPLRTKINTTISRTTPIPFKTPFKPGMGPSEPGRLSLGASGNGRTPQYTKSATPVRENWLTRERPPWNPPSRKQFFCLTSPTERVTLASSGLRPQQYEADELETMGINISMLNQITSETALYYSFHTTSSTPPPSTLSAPSAILGPAEALKELLDRGCVLATKPWVDNHWCLVLWKLAGMVALDPEKEMKPDTARWCWAEVIRQLLYRYERELNSGLRPPLRKIANQDAPAAFPMVLCVSNVLWSPGGVTDDGLPIEPHPELELTDGWYRLRAQVDLPMARAVRRGVIRVGRKLGVAGARLSTEKKDPTEILDAYNSTKLVLSGNSSHLMPWHAKLGFMPGPCISTLHSLTPDGGVVAALDFVIVKLYPIAFLEFLEDENGNKQRVGPRNEAEELEVNEKWKRRYEVEASKLRDEYDKKYARYEGYVDRLERKAGSQFLAKEDSYPPDNIDALYDELEYPDTAARVIARISPTDAGWLALHIRKQNEKGRELVGEEIEKELKTTCPPRDVRSFRILIAQDARTLRRPANRNAQLTVWDVLGLTLDEGSRAGTFEVGQRFMATNLVPTQQSAWMDCASGSEVFLSTRRDTRWTKIKKTQTAL